MTPDPYTTQPLTQSYRPATGPIRSNAALPTRSFENEPGRVDLGMDDIHDQPSVWDAVGYPAEHEFEFDSFWLRYERQAEARAIVDRPVDDSWQDGPIVKDLDADDTDEPTTPFEEAVEALFEGDYTRRTPVHRMVTADKLARLGEHAIIVLGTADGRPLDTPLGGVTDGDDEPEFAGTFDPDSGGSLDDIHYVAAFGQDRIERMTIDTDMMSPRFRLPESYEVITQDATDDDLEENDAGEKHEIEEIHWTRVIHVPEGELEDDIGGTPALKPVFHELLNIDKIKAASGEGYWRGGYQGLVVSPPTIGSGSGAKQYEFADEGDGVEEEIDEFLANFDRTLATTANVEPIESTVADPTAHLDINYTGIEVALGIPRSVFTGADRADTADSQAGTEWDTVIAGRQRNHNAPNILEPFVQRMIDVGIFPEPDGDGFVVEWPPRQELSEREEADVKNVLAQAMSRATAGDPSRAWTIPEVRTKFGDHPERGMEVDEEFQPDEDEEELEIDEAKLEQMQEQMDRPLPAEMEDQDPPGQGGQPPVPDGGGQGEDPDEDAE